jgi:hypothetical protein
MRSVIFVLFGLLMAATSAEAAPLRTWSDSTGQFKIDAEFVSSDGTTVKLRRADGTTLDVPLAKLSAADQTHVREQMKPAAPATTTASTPAAPTASAPTTATAPAAESATGPSAATTAKPASPPRKVPYVAADKGLTKRVTLTLNGVPLAAAAEAVGTAALTNVLLDERSLKKQGIDSAALLVNLEVKGQPLDKTLDLLAKSYGLEWRVEHDVVLLGAAKSLSGGVATLVYRSRRDVEPSELIENITQNVEPSTWSGVGGLGSIHAFGPLLVVRNDVAVHRKIAQFYGDNLPAFAAPAVARGLSAVDRVLTQTRDYDFVDRPLADVMAELATAGKISITIDEQALAAEQATAATIKVTFRAHTLRLGAALQLICDAQRLTFIATPKGIQITTRTAAEQQAAEAVYDVGDLVRIGETLDVTGIEALGALITQTIEPSSWENVGGVVGRLTFAANGSQVGIRQSQTAHLEIQRLFGALRAAR